MKYFGTDSIRGVYGEGMTEDLAYRAGRALAAVVGGRAFVARDTRSSGPAIEGALAAGIAAGGADVCAAGVLPTPAVSLLTAERGCSFGVEISASHNPPEYNGLKVFTPDGRKLPASAERAVEYYMDNAPPVSGGGVRTEWSGGAEAYAGYVLARVKELAAATGRPSDLRGLRVLLDCGGGAGTEAAKRVFGALGAEGAAQGDVCPVTPAVMVKRQPHPEGHIPPELLGPLFPQGRHRAAGQVLQMGRVEQPAGHAAHAVLYGQVGGAFVVGLLLHGSLIPPSAWRAWRLPSGSCGIPG